MEARKALTISLVAAVAENGAIGRKGGLPWHLKGDLRRFRELTMGHPMIMGGNTFRAIGRPLDGRDTIVLTRQADGTAAGTGKVFAAASWDEAKTVAEKCAIARGVTEIFAIGGASLYALALPRCGRIYLTRVHGAPAGDTFWNADLGGGWREVSRLFVPEGPEDDYPVTHFVLERLP